MSWAELTIDTLAALPGFPPASERAARLMLARMLEKIFAKVAPPDSDACPAAVELVERMIECYTKWPGPPVLFDEARKILHPEANAYYEMLTDDTGPLCEQCQSWGHVLRDGLYVRCTCPNGEALPQTMLDHLNARTEKLRGKVELVTPGEIRLAAKREARELRAEGITQEDIDRAVHVRNTQRALETFTEEKLTP